MSKNGTQMPDLDQHLDLIFADMAEDVPPVPDDFRQRWRQAVRLEAKASDRFEGKAEHTIADAKPAAAAAFPPKTARFLRCLQVAALFLFVLGGVLAAGPSLFIQQEVSHSVHYKDAPSAAVLPEATGTNLMMPLPEADLRGTDAVLSAESAMEETIRKSDAAPDLNGEEATGTGAYILDAQSGKTVSAGHLKNSLLPAEPASYAIEAKAAEDQEESSDFERVEEMADTAASEEGDQADRSTASEVTEGANDITVSEGGKKAADTAVSVLPRQIGGAALMVLSVLILILARRRQRHVSS